MNEKALRGALGLAFRAGQLIPGAEKALMAIRDGRAGLILVDESASDNTRKKLSDGCAHRNIPWHQTPEGILGEAIGRPGVGAAAILTGGMSDKIQHIMVSEGDKTPDEKNILEGERLNG